MKNCNIKSNNFSLLADQYKPGIDHSHFNC